MGAGKFMPGSGWPIPQYETRYEDNGSGLVLYAGWAEPGAGADEARWLIVKYIYTGTFTDQILFASDERTFDKVWDDRATYFA